MKSMIASVAAIALALLGSGAGAEEPSSPEGSFRDCVFCPLVTAIPGGKFLMGAEGGEEGRPEGPIREVTVPSFALGVYEVSHGEFKQFVDNSGYTPAGDCQVWPERRREQGQFFDWQNPGYGRPPTTDQPVACVSWLDAAAYTRWLSAVTGENYRLPSEAEWEYAARAGSTTAFFWGDDPEAGCEFANMNDTSGTSNGFPWAGGACDDGFAIASPVGSFAANAFGLYDMLGNVWEWTQDCYAPHYVGSPVDGSAFDPGDSCDRRSVRGGSWITRPDRNRASFRGRDPQDTVYFMFGFRVARDLEPDS